MDRGNSRSRPNRALETPMPTLGEAPSDRNVYEAVEDLLTPLGKLAALVAGGGAIAYMCGWQYLNAYFGRIGANWVLNLLSPTAVILSTLPALVALVTITAALLVVAQAGVKSRGMFKILAVAGVLLLFFLISFYSINNEEVAEGILAGLQVFGVLFLAAALAYLTVSVVEGALRPLEAKVIIYSTIILSLLVFGMVTTGKAAAQIDFYVGTSKLPVVQLSGDDRSKWRMAMALDNTTYLVFKPRRSGEDVVLRVIGAEDIAAIVAGKNHND